MQAQRRGIDPDTAPDALGSGGGAETFDYDAAALNAIQRRNYQETSSALAGKSAWSQNPNLVSLALATLGDAKGNRALRTAQTSSETAQADQYTRAGVLSTAKANRITGQDEFIKTLLNDPKQVKAFLESYGQKDSGDAVKNQVLAGTILNAPNREQAAAALETAKNIAAKANLLEQKAGYWKSYAGQRESEAGESGAMVKPGSLYDSATSLVIDRKTGGLGTGVGSGDITVRPELKMVLVNLFLALLDPKGKKLTKKQRVANRIEGVKLLEEKGYSPDDGTAIYEYITKGEY